MAKAVLLLALLISPAALNAQDWYRSNQAGMALEKIPSRIVALHYEWALSVESAAYAVLPALLRSYYDASYTMEQRLLYERGTLKRRQWIFRDRGGATRLNASLPADLSSVGKDEGSEIPAFIEIFSAQRTLTETHQYLVPGVYTTRYIYQSGLLIRAETFLDSKPLWADSYRYTRAAMLRGVERIYYEAGAYAEQLQGTSSRPPVQPSSPANYDLNREGQLDLRNAPPIPGFVNPVMPYDTSIMTDVLGPVYSVNAARVNYDLDSQGRVLAETRYDEEGEVLAEINNEWADDRIALIRWKSGEEEGRVVFRYSGKNRISEEDYRNGVLERRVSVRGDEEIEEIFKNEKLILRAVWKDGRKLSEERVRE